MVNSIGAYGSAANMWSVARSSNASATSSTEGTRKSPGEEMFSKLDADGSGGLSATELQSFVDKMSSDTRGALLSTQEAASSTSTSSTATTSAEDLLGAMDGDGDGSVSESELDAYMKANPPAGGPPPPPPPEESASASDTEGTDPLSQLFSAMDADSSGSVSESELTDFLAAMEETDSSTTTTGTTDTSSTTSTSSTSSSFDTIDTDGDGSISQAELDAYMKTQMGPPPPPPPPPPREASSDDGSTSTSNSSTSSTSSSTSSTADDLAQQLAAAMAQFASQAYGRVSSTSSVASLLATAA